MRAEQLHESFYNKNLSFISSRSQFIEKHNSCSHICSSIAIHAKKPTQSWHKAVKNMSKPSKTVTKGRFTLHRNCCEDSGKCPRRFKPFVGLFVDLLDSLKQGTTGNWILMTQMLAPANSAWVCWLCWLCGCSGNYTVKHKASFYIIWMNCTVMNLYSHSVLSLQTTLTYKLHSSLSYYTQGMFVIFLV